MILTPRQIERFAKSWFIRLVLKDVAETLQANSEVAQVLAKADTRFKPPSADSWRCRLCGMESLHFEDPYKPRDEDHAPWCVVRRAKAITRER